MTSIAIEEADAGLADLLERVEGGETIVVTRGGRPVLDLVPRRKKAKKSGFNYEAAEAYLCANGVVRTPGFIPDDFDDPLPEDFLIRPLPDP